MDPNQEIENIDEIDADGETEESVSVDDFIKQLEAREKDLHITADTTIIEITESFDDGNLPDFLAEEVQIEPAQSEVSAAVVLKKSKPGKPTNAKLEQELAGLKDTISQLQTEREEMVQIANRRAKDFENFKSRTERERRETFQNQIGNLAVKMLPALDNLNRAVDFALAMPEEQRVDIQQFLDGVVLVSQQVNDVLAEMGVQPIATVGETFDPHYHEAVATDDSEDLDPNTVSAELLRGYRIGDKVIRHSMVRVVTGEPRDNEDVTEDFENESFDEAEDLTAQDPPPEDLPDPQ
jgi:molecular chaperone GrpE